MTKNSDITPLEHGDVVVLDREDKGYPLKASRTFPGGHRRTVLIQPGQEWTCSDWVDPGDEMANPETRLIRTSFANSLQTPTKQFKIIR